VPAIHVFNPAEFIIISDDDLAAPRPWRGVRDLSPAAYLAPPV
jgi:hypothetical protein